MLVLARKVDEKIHIGSDVTVTIVSVSDEGKVRLGIDAPRHVAVHRGEVFDAIRREAQRHSAKAPETIDWDATKE